MDTATIAEVVESLPSLTVFPRDTHRGERLGWIKGTRTLLTWLAGFPGAGWQERWIASGADSNTAWLNGVDPRDRRSTRIQREEINSGVRCVLLRQVVLPGYDFLSRYKACDLFTYTRRVRQPEVFAEIERGARGDGVEGRSLAEALNVLTKIVLHAGRDVEQLTAED